MKNIEIFILEKPRKLKFIFENHNDEKQLKNEFFVLNLIERSLNI